MPIINNTGRNDDILTPIGGAPVTTGYIAPSQHRQPLPLSNGAIPANDLPTSTETVVHNSTVGSSVTYPSEANYRYHTANNTALPAAPTQTGHPVALTTNDGHLAAPQGHSYGAPTATSTTTTMSSENVVNRHQNVLFAVEKEKHRSSWGKVGHRNTAAVYVDPPHQTNFRCTDGGLVDPRGQGTTWRTIPVGVVHQDGAGRTVGVTNPNSASTVTTSTMNQPFDTI